MKINNISLCSRCSWLHIHENFVKFPTGSDGMVKKPPAIQETQVWSLGQKIPWSREWQPTAVFLPVKSHEQRSLVGYSSWGPKRVRLSDWPWVQPTPKLSVLLTLFSLSQVIASTASVHYLLHPQSPLREVPLAPCCRWHWGSQLVHQQNWKADSVVLFLQTANFWPRLCCCLLLRSPRGWLSFKSWSYTAPLKGKC